MNENHLTLFDGIETALSPVDKAFGWDALSPQEFIPVLTKHHQELKQQEAIADNLKQDVSVKLGLLYIVAKGKLGHGYFGEWLKAQNISYDKAEAYIKIAKELAEELNSADRRNLPFHLLREIAYSANPKLLLAKVESGKVDSTLDAIKEEKKKAQEEARQAKIEESKARADAQALQQKLIHLEESSHKEIGALTRQNEDLQQQLETVTAPIIEIREVEKEVIPQSVTNQLETLQKQVTKLKTDLEAEKGSVPQGTQRELARLQKQLESLQRENTQRQNVIQSQEERIKKLNADIDISIQKREFAESADRIRQKWRLITSETHSCLMRLLGQWPTPIDVLTFESEDWAEVEHLRKTLQRVLEECKHLHYGSGVIDGGENATTSLVIDAG